jgi:hypothetical protein
LEDWALAVKELTKTNTKIAPRRRGDAENSEFHKLSKCMDSPGNTRESNRSQGKPKAPNRA